MMKNFLILGGTAFGVYLLLTRVVRAEGVQPAAGGRTFVTTTGKTVTITQGKDGFMYDQFGGLWV